MECKFVVDQKVVCIADAWGSYLAGQVPQRVAERGCIYTISKIEIDFGMALLYLRELGQRDRWAHFGFRPLQDRPKEADTDISVFTPALNVKKLEPVT